MDYVKKSKTYKRNKTQWATTRVKMFSQESAGNTSEMGGSQPTAKANEGANTWDTMPGPKIPEKSPEEIRKEQMLENLKNWPWRGVPKKLVTLGPYLVNLYHSEPFILPKVEQSSLLFGLLKHGLIRHKIMDWVLRDHFDAANFAVTSRQSLSVLTPQIGFWDFTDGWFNNCERPRYGPDSSDDPLLQGSVQSVLLVTPVRHPRVEASRRITEKEGLYSKQMTNFRTMCRALSNFADYFNTLQLHRVPFLTIDILNLVIPNMRNLKVLGIYKCQLIHIGHTIRLLDVIKVDKLLEKEDQVYLDFFPNYHVGPKDFSGCTYYTGSYGVMWDNWNADTRLAIWALVARILPRALAQGIDLTRPGTAFRRWLEKSPCWRVKETLKDIMDPVIDPAKFVVSVDFPHYFGNEKLFLSRVPNRPEGWEWAVKSYKCYTCAAGLLGIFYSFTEIREARNLGLLNRPQSVVRCLGCMLTADLEAEQDHYKLIKRRIIAKWLQDDEGLNTNNLPRALEEFDEKNINEDIQSLDELRFKHMHYGPSHQRFDREHAERQNELSREEKGRLGMKNVAPHVGDEENWFVAQKHNERQWTYICKDRLWGHGHGA